MIGFCYGQLFELMHNGSSRIYWIDYPENSIEPTPLVISMHGRNQSLYSQIYQSEMSSFANPQNIAVVYPQGINSWGIPAWNTGVWWSNSYYDDVGHINALIDSVISNFAIDTNRIYAAGFSNGGFMAYDLACELPERIVAFGSVSGNFMKNSDQDCSCERDIPIMHIHGTSDPIVFYDPPTIDFSMTAIEAMEWWSIENNLTEQTYEELNNSVNIFTEFSLNSPAEFIHIQVEGGGHEWFDYDWGFHASEELLNFFMKYSMTDFFDQSPILSSIENHQTNEDSPLLIEVQASSPSGSSISYFAQSDTLAMPVYMVDNFVAVGLEANWNGTGNITVVAIDNDQLSDTTTFSVTVLPVNDTPADFELIYPTLTDTIPISVNTDETIPFTWGRSIDVDSEVSYKLSITLEYLGTSYTNDYEDISDTTYGVSAYEYAMLMTNLDLPKWNINYIVEANDGEFTVFSDTGDFVFDNSSLSIKNGIIPKAYTLFQNHPNPFNPITSLSYNLPEDVFVNITIYDMMGRVVKTLLNSSQKAGYKSIKWNATNNRNEPVSAGLYLYLIQAGLYTESKKMIFVK